MHAGCLDVSAAWMLARFWSSQPLPFDYSLARRRDFGAWMAPEQIRWANGGRSWRLAVDWSESAAKSYGTRPGRWRRGPIADIGRAAQLRGSSRLQPRRRLLCVVMAVEAVEPIVNPQLSKVYQQGEINVIRSTGISLDIAEGSS